MRQNPVRLTARLATIVAVALLVVAPLARAELAEIKVAKQYGIGYLSLMFMEDQKLIEKYAKAAGIDVTVSWATFAGGNVMNDALLSGDLHFASGGVGPLVTLWAKTHGNLDVKAVSAINSMPVWCMCICRSSPSPPVAVISGEAAFMRGPGRRPALISLRNTMSSRGFEDAAE